MGNNKSEGIFASWLKNFSIVVLTQSFHAVYLMFIMKFISAVMGGEGINAGDSGNFAEKQGILGIISIAGIWGLIKLEKLIKSLFGIQDSRLMGGIGENLTKSMLAIRSGMDLAKRTKEPFDKYKEAQKNTAAKRKAYNTALRKNEYIAGNSSNNTVNGGGTTSNQNYNLNSAGGNAALASASGNGSGNGAGNGNGGAQLSDDALNRLIMALENNANALQQGNSARNLADEFDRQENLKNAYQELQEAQRDEEAWKKKRVTRLATTVAAGAMGLGATDNMGDAVTFANLADKPMDWYTDRKVEKTANIDTAKRIYKEDYKAIQNDINRLKEIKDDLEAVDVSTLTPDERRTHDANLKGTDKAIKEYQKRAEMQYESAQKFLDDIPENVIEELGKTWVEMTDSTPVKPVKMKKATDITKTLDTSFNRTVRREVRDTINDIRRKPTQRNIDNVDDL